jgi:hypothetical protein
MVEGGFEKGDGGGGVSLINALATDGFGQAVALGAEGQAQGAHLAKDERDDEPEGVDFAFAL